MAVVLTQLNHRSQHSQRVLKFPRRGDPVDHHPFFAVPAQFLLSDLSPTHFLHHLDYCFAAFATVFHPHCAGVRSTDVSVSVLLVSVVSVSVLLARVFRDPLLDFLRVLHQCTSDTRVHGEVNHSGDCTDCHACLSSTTGCVVLWVTPNWVVPLGWCYYRRRKSFVVDLVDVGV